MNRDFVEERRNKILEYVNKNHRANIGELSEVFKTTEATIRRDLSSLENEKLVKRVHGGVLRCEQPSLWQRTSLKDRMGIRFEAKSRIARFLTQLIHDGESLMIDCGSTTILMAQELRVKKNLLVVTNAPTVSDIMVSSNENKVILTGGELLKETSSLIGPSAEHSLRNYRTDKAIFGVTGILSDQGCFSAIPQEAEIKRLMSLNSRESIVVCDSTKIGSRAFCFICDFTNIDKIVTDKDLSKADLEQLMQQGMEVYTV